MSRVQDFLNEAGVFYLATVDGNQPKCRPLGAHLEADGKVMFGVGDFKDVYKQLVANPRVEIVAAKPDGNWLRYTGKAVFETDDIYAQMILTDNPGLKNIYNEQTGHKMMVFHLENAKAVIIPVMGEGECLFDETAGDTRGMFDDNLAAEQLKKGFQKAEAILNDDAKIEAFLQKAEAKLAQMPKIGGALADIPVLISLLRRYVKKEYRDISMLSLVAVVSALLYWLSPIDVIPDSLFGIGWVDDVAVMGLCLKWIHEDMEKYREWCRAQGIRQ